VRPLRLRLQDRIVIFFVVLLAAVQIAAFYFIRQASEQTARASLREDLRVADRVFSRLLSQNSERLVEATRVLSSDYGFRQAIATRESATVLEALRNHAGRVRGSGMALIGLDGMVVGDTLDTGASNRPYAHPDLIEQAGRAGYAAGIRLRGGQAYQGVVVPVLAPVPVAWVAMSFMIDDTTARDLQRLSNSDVSFVALEGGAPRLLATTLPALRAQALLARAGEISAREREPTTLELGGEEFEVLSSPLHRSGGDGIHAVLQRSVAEGLAPSMALQALLLIVATASLAVTLVGGMRIARRITQPLSQLAGAATQVAQGNYAVRVETPSGDEMGELAAAFNGMAQGLAERDTMRDVLGKVASTEVVQRLLAGGIELGGTELEAAVMFTDIRNFTALCEQLTPEQSVQVLNALLTEISAIIERHGGVVDKYLGDGVMAIFGAPVTRPDDEQRALEAALEIRQRVESMGPELAARGLPHPRIGIGLNASRVIAGNIGSPTRLNYTVLGDGVNLASRLEGLTKRYLVPIVVSGTVRERTAGVVFRELDKVRVRGRTTAERIYEPLGREAQLAPAALERLQRWHEALAAFRERRWDEARAAFDGLAVEPDYERLVSLYRGYLRDLAARPPGADWDAAFTLYDK
jgi:adenylate cyclase